MPKYKVLKPCFIGGIFRIPGGPHDPVVAPSPLKKCSSLELIENKDLTNSKSFNVRDAVKRIAAFTDRAVLDAFVKDEDRDTVLKAAKKKIGQLDTDPITTDPITTDPITTDPITNDETTSGDTSDFMGDGKTDDDAGLETL